MDAGGPAWSAAVDQADWIAGRLGPFGVSVTSVVPSGYDRYARIFHPAEDPSTGDRVVRWGEVADWSGLPLAPDSQFHSVALPLGRPAQPAPWSSQGPRPGSMYAPDAAVLAEIVHDWTGTHDHCWFCVWDGWAWERTGGAEMPDPVPAAVLAGPRVRLPHRDYLLYTGPADAVLATADLSGNGQTANLWWPDDRTWCVATEIDLASTYVGGPAGLIEQILSARSIEALPAAPEDPLAAVAPWVTKLAEQAAGELFATGEATVATSRGTLRAWLGQPADGNSGLLRTGAAGDNGVTADSSRPLRRGSPHARYGEVRDYLASEIVRLVEQ